MSTTATVVTVLAAAWVGFSAWSVVLAGAKWVGCGPGCQPGTRQNRWVTASS